MNLREFRRNLSKLIESDYYRPFVCQGSPFDCEIFIVGSNPATRDKLPFWEFWDDKKGFNRDEWFKEYKDLRGKDKSSRTRNAINIFREGLVEKSSKLLETNLFSKQTKTENGLKNYDLNTKPFEFLFENIRPKLIYIHGSKTRKYFEKRYRKKLEKGNLIETNDVALKYKFKIIATNHLSRIAFKDVENVGRLIALNLPTV